MSATGITRLGDTSVLFDDGLYDRTEGTCQNGHRHRLDDLPGEITQGDQEALVEWDFYWKRGPFATLIRISTTYLHPEADDLESLQRLAKREDRPEMRLFKDELRQAITHPGG